jgi:hypothetical protein
VLAFKTLKKYRLKCSNGLKRAFKIIFVIFFMKWKKEKFPATKESFHLRFSPFKFSVVTVGTLFFYL